MAVITVEQANKLISAVKEIRLVLNNPQISDLSNYTSIVLQLEALARDLADWGF